MMTKFRDFSKIRIGDVVRYIAFGGNSYTGIVTNISQTIDKQALVLDIKAESYHDRYSHKTIRSTALLQVSEYYERPVGLVSEVEQQ